MANTLVIKWGRPAWSVLRRYILGNRPLWFFVAFGALTTYILWPFYPDEAWLRNEWVGNVAVEGFGFLMDIILFGLLWSVFDVYRKRRTKIRGYQDELVDYIPWEAQEGVLRKVGLIKRLNELRASLPFLHWIRLEGADLHFANLEGAHLSWGHLKGADLAKANLEGADLEFADLKGASLSFANLEGAHLSYGQLKGADLRWANLKGADLRSANLEDAKGLTWNQLELTETDDETILPTYLKENAPEWYRGEFEGEGGVEELPF